MTTADYIFSSDAPRAILVTGEGSFAPFVEVMGATVVENFDGEVCEIPFTHENAVLLRKFLVGKDFVLPLREKFILRELADKPEILNNPNFRWSIRLTDLRANPAVSARSRKIKGITTEWDLVHYLPNRYLDKTNPQTVDMLVEKQWATVVGEVISVTPDYKNNFVKIVIQDIKGQRISATFFRQMWLINSYREGNIVVIYGNYSIYVNRKGNKFPQITSAKIEHVNTSRNDANLGMLPIYPERAENVSTRIKTAQQDLIGSFLWIDDPVPVRVLKKYGLVSRTEAYKNIHFPDSMVQVEEARRRIAFDEFVRLQMFFLLKRHDLNENVASAKMYSNWGQQFVNSLPFDFTDAQDRVVDEILNDLKSNTPMNRLLQGDVGSGKTEISSVATLATVESGCQVALLAPTDILANQLFERLTKTFKQAGFKEEDVRVGLLTGRVLGKKRTQLLKDVADGTVHVLVGTHAIIQKHVIFKNLGLAVIDEQHKFGVDARTAISKQNENGTIPDMLSMSATPAPRTTAQIVYGNMDISVVDELPAERVPIETLWNDTPAEAWARIREEVEKGHQAYVVASLVSESDKLEDVEAATQTYIELCNVVYPDLRVGLLHGKLSRTEKEEVINAFYSGEIQILVATTVVEVGVNVPNATVMAILNANRFGMASLHQIRGRVGRGSHKSYCYLVGKATTPDAEERLNALVYSNDGFWLAEKDLEIRGEGELFGQLQSGTNSMYIGNLKEHKDLLEISKVVAKQASSSEMLKLEVDMLYKNKTIKA